MIGSIAVRVMEVGGHFPPTQIWRRVCRCVIFGRTVVKELDGLTAGLFVQLAEFFHQSLSGGFGDGRHRVLVSLEPPLEFGVRNAGHHDVDEARTVGLDCIDVIPRALVNLLSSSR